LRETRHDVEPERRFSARWWPVELLFQGSKKVRCAGVILVDDTVVGDSAARLEDEFTCAEEGGAKRSSPSYGCSMFALAVLWTMVVVALAVVFETALRYCQSGPHGDKHTVLQHFHERS
jgi:hypothetical protein